MSERLWREDGQYYEIDRTALDVFHHVAALDKALAPTDRVYAKAGRFFKVRVLADNPPPGSPQFGMLVFKLSGSHCDKDGWAKTHRQGHQIAAETSHTMRSDNAPPDLGAWLEDKRRECAAVMERAVLLEEEKAKLFPA